MGLDMYVYRATRPTEGEVCGLKGRSMKQIEELLPGVSSFDLSDDDVKVRLKFVRPWMTVIRRKHEAWDMEKLRADAGVPDDAVWWGTDYEDGTVVFHYGGKDGGEEFDIDLKKATAGREKEFLVVEQHSYGLVRLDQVAYWRKNYDLQEAVTWAWRAEHPDEELLNCGYYPLNAGMLEMINGEREGDLERIPGTELFYHEWY